MSILVNRNTIAICQGMTGNQGTIHSIKAMQYGVKLIGGITPGKGNKNHLGLPIFDNVKEITKFIKVDASIIYVPAEFAKEAIIDSIQCGIKIIICITEGIPILDMVIVKHYLLKKNIFFLGPNSPGIITPGECKLGIMPGNIYKKGAIGIISRSGTLTYEVVKFINDVNLGQSTCIGIGGDKISGCDYIDLLKLFEKDKETKCIIMIGEIGGIAEEEAAEYIKAYIKKPVIAYIAGIQAPINKKMGHANAIIEGKKDYSGYAKFKIKKLQKSGVLTLRFISDVKNILRNIFFL